MHMLVSQVIAGIILGPSVLGRIPFFDTHIIPYKSLEFLKLIALIGKDIYMFLIGLQIDLPSMKSQISKSRYIAIVGVIVPILFGLLIAKVLLGYEETGITGFEVALYFLFVGCPMAITALPVLSHILAEQELTDTIVGETAMSAAIVDDLIAWMLLALIQILERGKEPTTQIRVIGLTLLSLVLYFAFLWFVVRPLVIRYAKRRKEGDDENQKILLLILMFSSAFYTQSIGISSFWGALLMGLVMPRDYALAHALVESMDDLIEYLLMPIYFSLVGIQARFDLFGWLEVGYTAFVILIAFISKTVACALAAKFTGRGWRESFAIGILMNTKGLIEIIILDLGLEKGIISKEVYTMFVAMMIILTAITVPMTMLVYPFKYHAQRKLEVKSDQPLQSDLTLSSACRKNTILVLTDFEAIPGAMTLLSIFSFEKMTINLLRLIDLGERPSRMIVSSNHRDEVMNDMAYQLLERFCEKRAISLSAYLDFAPKLQFQSRIGHYGYMVDAEQIFLPVKAGCFDSDNQSWTIQTFQLLFKERTSTILAFYDHMEIGSAIETLHIRYSASDIDHWALEAFANTIPVKLYCPDKAPVEFASNVTRINEELDIDTLGSLDTVVCSCEYFIENYATASCSFFIVGTAAL